jgi:hypothetical protein
LWEAIEKEAKRYTEDGIAQLEEIWYEQKIRLSNS